MFEHARRLLLAIETLTGALAPNSNADKLAREEPAAVQDAWRQTQQMQAVFLALLQSAREPQHEDPEPA